MGGGLALSESKAPANARDFPWGTFETTQVFSGEPARFCRQIPNPPEDNHTWIHEVRKNDPLYHAC